MLDDDLPIEITKKEIENLSDLEIENLSDLEIENLSDLEIARYLNDKNIKII